MKTAFVPSVVVGLLVALSVSSATVGALPGPQPSHRSDRSIAQQAIERTAQIKETSMAAAAALTPEELVALGEDLFFNGTFDGNGRTCGSCHRREDAFGLSPASIASLPGSDPLFVAEFDANLADLEHPPLMRSSRGLILENIDGFGEDPVFRNSPHFLNLALTAPYGLSGEFPDLQVFATGAVMQHFPKTLNRQPGVDFRLPTAEELAAMEAFMNTVFLPEGQNFALERFVTTTAQRRGSDLFFSQAKCFNCHNGPVLAEAVAALGGGNENFDTGVTNLPINLENRPENPGGGPLPQEAGGDREFNTPPLFGVAGTAPFFHDSSVATLADAVKFYDSAPFNLSPGGALVGLISLLPAQVEDLVAFLESLIEYPFEVTPGALFFGPQELSAGSTASQVVTLNNLTVDPIIVESVALSGGNAGEFSVNVVAADTFEVTFDPSTLGLKRTTLEVQTDRGSIGVRVVGVGVGPEGQATFVDVPTGAPFFQVIEAVHRAGITAGCTSAPAYCPGDPVTRAQAAVLLTRAMGLGEVPPRRLFSDVIPTTFGAGSIERLAAEGVTNGCGGGNYCPGAGITRAEFAVLLVRASGRTPIAPPTGTAFADVPAGSFGAGAIERLKADGVTNGCGGGNFCPGQILNRAEAAALIAKAFSLPLP